MQGKMTILKTDGGQEIINEDQPMTLAKLQMAVGGFIQILPGFDSYLGEPAVAFCDEEGRNKGKPYNPKATQLWAKALGMDIEASNALCGDIAIVQGDAGFMEAL